MFPVRISSPFQYCGLFGAKRRYDTHTGVDFYCKHGEPVLAVLDGIVTDVFIFTGPNANTPWWNETYAVVVESGELTYVYGEVIPSVEIGDMVREGDTLGNVTAVLKTDKGITPINMLHLEVWETAGYLKNFTWLLHQEKPLSLIDPLTTFRKNTAENLWLIKTECGYRLELNDGTYVGFFAMPANSKAYTQGQKLTYLRESSSLEDRIKYTIATGKALWFDCKDKWRIK